MRSSTHAILAAIVIISAAAITQSFVPQQSMAKGAKAFNLRATIPSQIGDWKLAPDIKLVQPEDDSFSRLLYSQEIAVGYRNAEGQLLMLLVAYGPNQSARLQLHRPELCYTASGFRVSGVTHDRITYQKDAPPLEVLRLTAERESRFEPITYWMRIGDSVATNVIERQIIRLRLALSGKIADGALVRVSTLGAPVEVAYQLQDRFIRELLSATAKEDLNFLVGRH